jgi:hypothetical protein
MPALDNKISIGTGIQSEVAEKLLQSQNELKLEMKTGMENIAMQISSLQAELQKLATVARD